MERTSKMNQNHQQMSPILCLLKLIIFCMEYIVVIGIIICVYFCVSVCSIKANLSSWRPITLSLYLCAVLCVADSKSWCYWNHPIMSSSFIRCNRSHSVTRSLLNCTCRQTHTHQNYFKPNHSGSNQISGMIIVYIKAASWKQIELLTKKKKKNHLP